MTHRPQTWLRPLAVVVLVLIAASACGSSSSPQSATAAAFEAQGDSPFVGYERDPEPTVGSVALPAANRDTDSFAFKAEADKLLMVSFGYSSCPDVCPTTLLDARVALNGLEARAADVDYAFVSIDPTRDNAEVLSNYVEAFLEDGIALRTDDPDALAVAADAFGVFYTIEEVEGGGEPEVAHTASIFLVDDTGSIVLTWPFGTAAVDITSDLNLFLDRVQQT